MMNPQRSTNISKFISKHLRHHPPVTPLYGGWIPVKELLDIASDITEEELLAVLKSSSLYSPRVRRFQLGRDEESVLYSRATFNHTFSIHDSTLQRKRIYYTYESE